MAPVLWVGTAMKCPGCGAEVMDGAKNCPHCGRELGLGTRTVGETEHLAKEAGAAATKVGHGVVGGMKGLVSGVKKGVKGDEAEKKS